MVYTVRAFLFIDASVVRAAGVGLQKLWLGVDSQVGIHGVIEILSRHFSERAERNPSLLVRSVGFSLDFGTRNFKNTRLGCYHFAAF